MPNNLLVCFVTTAAQQTATPDQNREIIEMLRPTTVVLDETGDFNELCGLITDGLARSKELPDGKATVLVYTDREKSRRDAVVYHALSLGARVITKSLEKWADNAKSYKQSCGLSGAKHRRSDMSPYTIGLPGDLDHFTTTLVLDMANLMGQKLMAAQAKRKDAGKDDQWHDIEAWAEGEEGPAYGLRMNLFQHILKGDPVDVANISAFAQFHGLSVAPQKRHEAQAWVAMLQEKFDLIDDNTILRELLEKMEERHSETFNSFYEAIIKRFLLASGLKSVEIDTSNLFSEVLAMQANLVIEEKPGKLVYSLKQDDEKEAGGGILEDSEGRCLGAMKND